MLTEQLIITPVFTSKIKRLLFVIIFFSLVPYLFCKHHTLLYLLEIMFLPFIIIACSIICIPLEKIINQYYIHKAKKKLNKIKPIILGITGSYGKTSTKNYIYHLIKQHYFSYMSPLSYNTQMGLARCINEKMPPLTEVFIAEAGASQAKDIEKIVKHFEFNIGIITDIGPQHLETFGNIENVLNTKLEILKSKALEVLIINNDNIYLKKVKYPVKVIRVGFNKDADYYVDNIEMNENKTVFDVFYKQDYFMHIETSLIGRHNIYNLLFSIASAIYLGVPKDVISNNISKINPVDNRLSLTKTGNIKILNDAFSTNIVGFKNALEVLKGTSSLKVVITPGIVDLGKKLKELNIEISKELITGLDMIYLIDNEASRYIEEYFISQKFLNYKVCKTFKEAYHDALKNKEEVTILIENDLPDNYLRR
ncbi:MAG: hypothetical protein IJX78_04005 [Bacilli bacterium]|nr:hypothetical protein [Bacilli bacterium]